MNLTTNKQIDLTNTHLQKHTVKKTQAYKMKNLNQAQCSC
jgi:hypothetical protein